MEPRAKQVGKFYKLQICINPKHLNEVIRHKYYKLPTAEELFSKMHNAKFSQN